MRRSEKEIVDAGQIDEILLTGKVCRLGLSADNIPYVVPMFFGYAENTLFFHSARDGRKLDFIRQNPNACFEIDMDVELISNDQACRWSATYRSVIGYGDIVIVTDLERKQYGLSLIMKQCSGSDDWVFQEKVLANTYILALSIDSITGKAG
jgi:uncharacterized protein